MATVISWVLLISVKSAISLRGAPDASYLQTIGTLLLNGNDTIGTMSQTRFPFGCSDVLLDIVQNKTHSPLDIRLGSHCAGWVLVMTSLDLFGISGSWSPILVDLLDFPIFLQEMVLAVWLIVKGFNPSAIASLSAKTSDYTK